LFIYKDAIGRLYTDDFTIYHVIPNFTIFHNISDAIGRLYGIGYIKITL
jgi:hypothetical protein